MDAYGTSPLGAGLRFLPLTAFVFFVPILTRGIAQRVQAWVLAALGMLLVSIALLLMHGLTAGSSWTALLPGFVLGGIGIGLANPTVTAFVSGLNAVLLVGSAIVFAGAIAAAVLMRVPATRPVAAIESTQWRKAAAPERNS